MRSIVFNLNGVTIASYIVGTLAMLLIYLVMSDKRVPVIAGDKAAFIVLWLMGLAMSILAGTRDYPDGKFAMAGIPLTILMVLGFLAFAVLGLKLIGVKLPGIMTYRQAFNLTAGIIMVKWVTVHLYKVWTLLQTN